MSNSERMKTEYDRRIKTIQKDIDRCEDYKTKIAELEINIKSKFLLFKNL